MIELSEIGIGKSAFVFELDDVLYPVKDYDLQVYYLFANLLEYTEGTPLAAELTSFLKKAYEAHGTEDLFDRASQVFGIDEKYRANFNKMAVDAQLPLRLILYPNLLRLLRSIRDERKDIFILTRGNPLIQLNKIKYMDWEGLEKYLKVYFYDEIKIVKKQEPLQYLLEENKLKQSNLLFIGRSDHDRSVCHDLGIDFLDVSLLMD